MKSMLDQLKFCILFVLLSTLINIESSYACDPCSLYSVSRLLGSDEGTYTLSLAEQFTKFKSIDSASRPREGEIGKSFSTTQLGLTYDLTESLGLQLSLPFIYRNFDSYDRFRADSDSEFGIGDMVIGANYALINKRKGEWTFIANSFFGIKLPTGDTGSLANIPLDSTTSDEMLLRKDHTSSGALGGRALSIGSGSTDFLFGLSAISRFDRFLLLTSAQYTYRTEGSFNYEFADDVVWSFGPGYYLLVEEKYSLATRAVLSGEHKGKDKLNNERLSRSQIGNIYVGPEVILSWKNYLLFDLGADFLISDTGKDSLITPDFRVRSGVSYRF